MSAQFIKVSLVTNGLVRRTITSFISVDIICSIEPQPEDSGDYKGLTKIYDKYHKNISYYVKEKPEEIVELVNKNKKFNFDKDDKGIIDTLNSINDTLSNINDNLKTMQQLL